MATFTKVLSYRGTRHPQLNARVYETADGDWITYKTSFGWPVWHLNQFMFEAKSLAHANTEIQMAMGA